MSRRRQSGWVGNPVDPVCSEGDERSNADHDEDLGGGGHPRVGLDGFDLRRRELLAGDLPEFIDRDLKRLSNSRSRLLCMPIARTFALVVHRTAWVAGS